MMSNFKWKALSALWGILLTQMYIGPAAVVAQFDGGEEPANSSPEAPAPGNPSSGMPSADPLEGGFTHQSVQFTQPQQPEAPPYYNAFAHPQYFSNPLRRSRYNDNPAPGNSSCMRPPPGWLYPQAQSVQIPSGLMLPVSLQTTISTQSAKPGDYIQARVANNVNLGGPNYLPGGTVVTGEVAPSKPGQKHEHADELTIDFTQMRLPGGMLIPISAHLVGDFGNYRSDANRSHESVGGKIWNFAMRAGIGTVLGEGIGSLEYGGGRGIGEGAMSGFAGGSFYGAMDGMFSRRRNTALVNAGTQMQIQLDEPVQFPSGANRQRNNYQGRY